MTNIFNNKKNINNTSQIQGDEVIANSNLLMPRLSTAERDANNFETGSIIWNTTTNEYQILDESLTWEIVSIGSGGSGFVTITGPDTITGLKKINNEFRLLQNTMMGTDQTPTSVLHIKATNPSLQIESSGAGENSTILMKGTLGNIYDYGFNTTTMEMTSGDSNIKFKQGGNSLVVFDTANKSISVGDNPATLPKVRALFNSGINEDHSVGLPRMSALGESGYITTVAADPQYDGSIWYNTTTNELRGIFNNVAQNIHHGGTTTITNANIADVSSTVVGINDTQTFTNKTIDANNNTITNINANSIANGVVDNTEFQYLDGVTSSIQTQLNAKVDLTSTQSISGSKTFQNNGPTDKLDIVTIENTSATLGNPRASGVLLKGSTVNNVTNEWSIYTEGNLDDTLCFYNYKLFPGAGGVKMSIDNNSLNLPQSGQSYKIQGNDVLNSTTLGSGVLSSSLTSIGEQSGGLNISTGQTYKINNIEALSNTKLRLNNQDIINQSTSTISGIVNGVFQQITPSNNLCHFVNSDIRVDGATGNDAVVNIIRSTGEIAKLKSTTAGYEVENNTQVLYRANNTGLDLLVGDYKKNGVNVLDSIPWTLTFQEYITNSTSFVPVTFFLYTTGRVWNNITVVTNDIGTGDVQFELFNITQASAIVTSAIIGPALGVVTTTLNLGGGFPNQNDIIGLYFRKNSGGGSKNLVCASIR